MFLDHYANEAFLREVMEERYVSGFGMHMPYNDARRFEKSDGAIAVPYFMVGADNTRKPERMPYAQSELNSIRMHLMKIQVSLPRLQ